MTEVQARTSLPHTHSVAWRRDLPDEVVETLHFLQQDEWTTRLTAAQVSGLVICRRRVITRRLFRLTRFSIWPARCSPSPSRWKGCVSNSPTSARARCLCCITMRPDVNFPRFRLTLLSRSPGPIRCTLAPSTAVKMWSLEKCAASASLDFSPCTITLP